MVRPHFSSRLVGDETINVQKSSIKSSENPKVVRIWFLDILQRNVLNVRDEDRFLMQEGIKSNPELERRNLL